MPSSKSMTGIVCDDNCLPSFHKVSKQKIFKYVIFRLSDDKKSICFDKGGHSFEEFREDLLCKKEEPCYAAYDFHYTTVDGQSREKIAFLMVCSDDDVPVMKKMLYTSTKPELLDKLNRACFAKEIQVNDFDDLNEEELVNYISNNKEK